MADQPADPNKDNPQNPNPQGDGSSLPDKFKGKSPEEIVSSYVELEKKLSQVTAESGTREQRLRDLEALEKFIDSDPESLDFLRGRIQGKGKGKQIPSQQPSQTIDTKYDDLKADITDAKLATQAQIFEKFEGKYGLNENSDTVKEIKKKIGDTIKQMVAPKSQKSPTEIMASLPLDTLPMYLENAYKLATADDEKEKVRRKTIAQTRQNSDGIFGDIPSSSLQRNSTTLTAEEKKVAKGLGLTDEKYLTQKKAIAAEYEE